MTLLGKIFCVLIFIMSLAWMGMTVAVYQTQTNWRDKVKNPTANASMDLGLEPQLKQAEEKKQELLDEIERLKHMAAMERGARVHAIAALASKNRELAASLIAKRTELEVVSKKERDVVAAMTSTTSEVSRLGTEAVDLRGQILDTQSDRDTQFAKVVALMDQIHQLRGVEKRLTERQHQLMQQAAQYKGEVEKYKSVYGELDTPPAPAVEGIVTSVSEKNLIEISIGADEGLAEGHNLNVFRASTFLGRVVVRRTSSDKSVAEIIRPMLKGQIKRGDRVETTNS